MRSRAAVKAVRALAPNVSKLFGQTGREREAAHARRAAAASDLNGGRDSYLVLAGPPRWIRASLALPFRYKNTFMPLPPIVFEDDALVVFDKPSGMLVAPDRWDKKRENLMGLVHAHPRFGPTVANVHRLDADTSGLLLCAKSKQALDFLSGQFQSKTVEKRYHALVVVLAVEQAMKVIAPVRDENGVLPETFTVAVSLGEDERQPGRMRVFKGRGGKECVSDFRALERFRGAPGGPGYAFLECRPLTGRTHQLRIHLAAAGAPILNDPFYGAPEIKLLLSGLKRRYKGREEEKPLIARLALHASELTLNHPGSRGRVTFQAPLPHEFEVALKYLRKFAATGVAK